MALRHARDVKRTARFGFSMIELIAVASIIAVMALVTGPAMSRIVRHNRVNRAATIITSDLQNAFAVAARQRQPVRIQADETTKSYQFIDRRTGAVLRIRTFYGDTSEYRLTKLKFAPTTVDVYPSGVSSAPITIDLANGDYARRITASSAGFIRLVPNP